MAFERYCPHMSDTADFIETAEFVRLIAAALQPYAHYT
jgi:hypothetical protein